MTGTEKDSERVLQNTGWKASMSSTPWSCCFAMRSRGAIPMSLHTGCWMLSAASAASMQELTSIPGIGENAAALILMVPQIVKKAHVSKAKETKIIRNYTDAGNYLLPYFLDEQDEIVMMLCLDNKRAVICCREMGRGVVNCVDANIRRMVETALKVKTTTVIIAHNHPNGVALPSREDDNFTRTLYRSLGLLGITLEDHIIVANDEFVSLADSGVMHLFKY